MNSCRSKGSFKPSQRVTNDRSPKFRKNCLRFVQCSKMVHHISTLFEQQFNLFHGSTVFYSVIVIDLNELWFCSWASLLFLEKIMQSPLSDLLFLWQQHTAVALQRLLKSPRRHQCETFVSHIHPMSATTIPNRAHLSIDHLYVFCNRNSTHFAERKQISIRTERPIHTVKGQHVWKKNIKRLYK